MKSFPSLFFVASLLTSSLLASCVTERTVSEDGQVQEEKVILKVPGEQVLKNTFEEDRVLKE